jgi:hypothetical protein
MMRDTSGSHAAAPSYPVVTPNNPANHRYPLQIWTIRLQRTTVFLANEGIVGNSESDSKIDPSGCTEINACQLESRRFEIERPTWPDGGPIL